MKARERDSEVTRQRLLAAAAARFRAFAFDEVTLRDIGADAGVDPSLISRYFGGKEGLFRDVLTSLSAGSALLAGPHEGFGTRVAAAIVNPAADDGLTEGILLGFRAAGCRRGAEIVRASARDWRCALQAWIGTPHAAERAYLISSAILGAILEREILGMPDDPDLTQAAIAHALAHTIQRYLDADWPARA